MTDFRIVFVSFPTSEMARDTAARLVDERLAACCTLLPGCRSIYRWEGSVEQAEETLLLVKTTGERLSALTNRIAELHSYEVPEILAVPVETGLPAYLKWVVDETART